MLSYQKKNFSVKQPEKPDGQWYYEYGKSVNIYDVRFMQYLELIGHFVTMYKGICVAIGLVLAVLLYDTIVRSKMRLQSDQSLLFALLRNTRYPGFAVVVSTGFLIFLKSFDAAMNSTFLVVVVEITLIGCVAWALFKIIETTERHYVMKDDFSSFTASILGTITQILLLLIVGLMILDKLGVNVSGILAVGGIGGIVLGLASKDLFANFFGFITIVLDRPFKVGDLISSRDKDIRGVVDKITWRITRVITLEKQPVYIPNSIISTIIIQNESEMLARRISETLKFEFKDHAMIPDFTDKVKAFLVDSKLFDQRFPGSFDVIKIGSSIVEIRLIVYTTATAWVEFSAVRQQVLLDIFETAKNTGLAIVYPETQICIYDNRQSK